MLFDSFSQMIFKEESMKVLNKIPTDDSAKEEFLKSEYYKNMTLHWSSSEVYIDKYHLNENKDDEYYLESEYFD